MMLKKTKPGAMAKKTYKTLVDDTFVERRNYVKQTARSSAEVLDMCPYLGKQEYVSDLTFGIYLILCTHHSYIIMSTDITLHL